MSIVGSFHSVYADIRSPWSLLFLSNSIPRILISIISLPQAYWTQGWYVRRHPCNKAHHWSQFCCDTFFSWALLSSFCHCSSAGCGTEMANVNKFHKWIHSPRVEFPLVGMSTSWFFGVDVLDLDLGVQTDSIKQPIKCNSVGLGNMYHYGTLMIILITASLSFNTLQESFLIRRLDVWGNTINVIQHVGLALRSWNIKSSNSCQVSTF